jgi:hypothetical protein
MVAVVGGMHAKSPGLRWVRTYVLGKNQGPSLFISFPRNVPLFKFFVELAQSILQLRINAGHFWSAL